MIDDTSCLKYVICYSYLLLNNFDCNTYLGAIYPSTIINIQSYFWFPSNAQ